MSSAPPPSDTGTNPALQPYFAFPPGFRWGVAAAAYQIEGAVRAEGRGPSIWDRFCERPGAIKNGDSGEHACDHYHRFEEDLDLMASLGVRNYRFSFAWPRIFPTGTGAVNRPGLAFYDRLIDGMLKRGIQPMATCYHWDLPQALEDCGGWRSRQTAQRFAEFAAVLAQHFSDRIPTWATLNEPWVSWHLGYGAGGHAPGARETGRVFRNVAHHLLLAHGLATQALRANARREDLRIGMVHNPANFVPFTDSPEDIAATRTLWKQANGWLLGPVFDGRYPEEEWNSLGPETPEVQQGDLAAIAQPLDFLGLNVYSANEFVRARGGAVRVEEHFPRTDFHWPIAPQAIYWTVRFAHEVFNPGSVFITENGCCYPDQVNEHGRIEDLARVQYLRNHLEALHRATAEGLPLHGYFLWSILDNFEWAEGYSKRFGIVHVNYNTQKRTPKASAQWYARVIKLNGF